ncbi:MAG TPA: peptidylprolyl isomerase [Devosiaceae bacterium]
MLRWVQAITLGVLLGAGLAAPAFAVAVKVTVNGSPITDAEIAARAKLIALERRGNSNSERTKLATDELINESLEMGEAKRLGIEVTDQQVNAAYLNVARNLKVSADKLTLILTQNGVNPSTLKARLRAGIAWGGVTQKAVAPQVQISDLKLDEEAQKQLDASNSFDYMLKEVLFIIPKGSKVSAATRTAQANQYRKNFSGCDSAVDLSLSYTDAAVRDVGRRHATQLPDAVATELASLPVGGITKPRVVADGVSMLAICSKAQARDATFLKQKLRNQTGQEQFKSDIDTYLQKLKDQASIVYQ